MLSKTSLQAVKALVELAKLPPGRCEGAGAIARKIHAPQNYLGKLLQSLTGEGLVSSHKGMGGGFRLNKDPKKIALYDVVNPLEGVDRWTGCVLGRSKCSDSAPCHVHGNWKGVREAYLNFLQKTTIADLI